MGVSSINLQPTQPAKASSHGGSHGVLGFVKNLGGDVVDTATGFLPGMYELGKAGVHAVEGHPHDLVNIAKQVGHSTWHDWSPLFHGHVGEWAHNTYDHPLAPLLDAATVFTLGDSALAKTGSVLSKAADEGSTVGKIADTLKSERRPLTYKAPEVKYGDNAEVQPPYTRLTKATPMKRAMQEWVFHHPNYLPKWYADHENVYARLRMRDMMGRHVANIARGIHAVDAFRAHLAAATQAGKTLDQAEQEITPVIFRHNYESAARHAYEHDAYVRTASGRAQRVGGLPVTRDIPEGFAPLLADGVDLRKALDYRPGQDFEHRLEHLAEDMTMNPEDFRKGMKEDPIGTLSKIAKGDKSGHIKLVKTAPLNDVLKEGSRSSIFLKNWYRIPTRVWKMAFVGLSPKMVVDNAVGNYTMYGIRQMGHHAIHGLIDAAKQSRSIKAQSELARYLNPHWSNSHFADELNNEGLYSATMGEALDKHMSLDEARGALSPKGLKGGFYPAVHKFADQPVRRAALNAFMRGHADVKAFMAKGYSYDKAVEKALANGAKGRLLRQQAVDHIRDIAGDYRNLTQGEQFAKDLAPFYLWNRHILRHVRNLVADEPGKVAAMQRLASIGHAAVSAQTGALPSFMDTMVPLGGTQPNGHMQMLDTRGLAPYSSVGDLTDLATSLVGGQRGTTGDAISGAINPLLTAAIESATGHRMGTDAAVPGSGFLQRFGNETVGALPQVRIADAALHGGSLPVGHNAKGQPKQPLYAKDLHSLLTNLAGVPIKDVNMGVAHGLARKEQGLKKGRGTHGRPLSSVTL